MADIKLQDALEEIYELNPIEYRWKKYEKEAPELTDDFKWNFLSEIKQPQHEISGPSVGSLLYALNPQTSELGLKQMENLTYDRLHTNGTKALYPTFVNLGNKDTLEGSQELFIIKFKAKKKGIYNLKMQDAVLVDKLLNTSNIN